MQLQIHSLDLIHETARKFLQLTGANRVFAFEGEMGAGKTTFIKALCEELGVTDTVNSPSFAIVNEYTAQTGKPVYHFDFYRIKNVEEAFDFGYEDYFYSGNYCFIEWPKMVENLLPDSCVEVFIGECEDGSRIINISNY